CTWTRSPRPTPCAPGPARVDSSRQQSSTAASTMWTKTQATATLHRCRVADRCLAASRGHEMSPRPREAGSKDLPPNLYRKKDKRNGETYYNYRDPVTGRMFGLGKDKAAAVRE